MNGSTWASKNDLQNVQNAGVEQNFKIHENDCRKNTNFSQVKTFTLGLDRKDLSENGNGEHTQFCRRISPIAWPWLPTFRGSGCASGQETEKSCPCSIVKIDSGRSSATMTQEQKRMGEEEYLGISRRGLTDLREPALPSSLLPLIPLPLACHRQQQLVLEHLQLARPQLEPQRRSSALRRC